MYINNISTPNIIKDECTFQFSNFLIVSLCNSSANSWFDIFSLLTAPPEVFHQKNVQTIEASPH